VLNLIRSPMCNLDFIDVTSKTSEKPEIWQIFLSAIARILSHASRYALIET